jgi:hypothetical protein
MNGGIQLQHKRRKTMLYLSFDFFVFIQRFSEVAQRSNPRYELRNMEKDPASFGQQRRDLCRKGEKIEEKSKLISFFFFKKRCNGSTREHNTLWIQST